MNEKALEKLQAATPASAIKYLPKGLDKEAKTALAIPYVSARFVQTRLDEALGPLGWQSDVKEIRGFVCVGVGIQNDEGYWIWRWDTGQEDQTEASGDGDDDADEVEVGRGGAKAIISRGLKRCGVQFGIGRDIYDYPKRRYSVNLNRLGKFSGWAEDINPLSHTPRAPQPERAPQAATHSEASPTGGPVEDAVATSRHEPTHPVDESLVFSKFAHDNHATQEQIAKAIQQATPADGGKTDWPAARRFLAEAVDSIPF